MWESGSIDNDGGDIVWCPEGGRERYLGENWLDFGGNEDIFDERGDDGALAHPFITANTDPDCDSGGVSHSGGTLLGWFA